MSERVRRFSKTRSSPRAGQNYDPNLIKCPIRMDCNERRLIDFLNMSGYGRNMHLIKVSERLQPNLRSVVSCYLYADQEHHYDPTAVTQYQSPSTLRNHLIAPLSWSRQDLFLVDYLNLVHYSGGLTKLLDYHSFPTEPRANEPGAGKEIMLVIYLQRVYGEPTDTPPSDGFPGSHSDDDHDDQDKNFMGKVPPYRVKPAV